GNSSFEETDKKSYSVKLSEKADLFGMGEAKKWILSANAFDDTLLRNVMAFQFAKILKLAYTPDVQYVDVYANGRFIGNYLLSERIEVGKNRVNIRNLEDTVEVLNGGLDSDSLEFFMEPMGRLFSCKGYMIEHEPEDLSGGYLLELETSDRYGLEASGFLTSRMQPVVFNSPKYASHEQVAYVSERYQDFEDAIFSKDGYSPYTGKHYSDYIDMESFARKYLVEELAKNLDASFTSQYIYKYDDSISDKFYAGPCWDYDKSIAAYGITNDGIDLHDPDGLYAAVQEKDSDIWYALYQHEDFRGIVAEIFSGELEPQLRKSAAKMIYGYSKQIDLSNDCNMIRWNTFPQSEGLSAKREMHNGKVEELVVFIDKRLDFLKELFLRTSGGGF
ncbi:MAG: CotH kinase family protein, partial [Lachnospiraceae bacterium]|nr:CotH kinase family protein [Lachnospiraceae bacterium]